MSYTFTDTLRVSPGEDYLGDDAPVSNPPSEPEADTPSMPTYPYIDPDMPGGVPVVPGDPETPVPPMTEDDIPEG